MNRQLAAVLLYLTAAATFAAAAPAQLWFEQANAFYKQERFDSAAAYYQKAVDAGTRSSVLYYNLGNACFRLGHMGPAILNYERARQLAPTDPDIDHNLRFARLNIVDRVPTPQRGFVETLLLRAHALLPLGAQLWLASGLLLALALMFAMGLFASHNARLWLVYGGSLLALVLALLVVSLAVKIYEQERVQQAVVLAPSADARNAPQGDKVLFTAHEGTTLRIRETADAWCLVSLPNGVSGWVETGSLGRI